VSGQSTSWGSPTPQGPGWWQASDGLYYPPQGPQPAPAPVFHGTVQSVHTGHPVQVGFSGPLEVSNRWLPLYAWLLAIPHFFRALGPFILGIVHTYVALFTTLFGAKVPQSSHDAIVKMWQCQWQLTTFALVMRESAPTFDDTDPAVLRVAYTGQSVERFGPFLKPFKALGKFIALIFVMILASIHMLIGFFGVLMRSAWPQSSRDYLVDAYRKATEFNNYLLLSDVKPS
jgi:hypothetical protein